MKKSILDNCIKNKATIYCSRWNQYKDDYEPEAITLNVDEYFISVYKNRLTMSHIALGGENSYSLDTLYENKKDAIHSMFYKNIIDQRELSIPTYKEFNETGQFFFEGYFRVKYVLVQVDGEFLELINKSKNYTVVKYIRSRENYDKFVKQILEMWRGAK